MSMQFNQEIESPALQTFYFFGLKTCLSGRRSWTGKYDTTRNQIILTKQSGRVPKNLTASKILQISIALCQIKAKIHSFPTMYIIGGGKFGLTR